jgi:hypothetical protein
MRGDKRIAGEGDQIVPYTWHTYGDSKMVHEQGIKYISALPLFNPDLLYGQITISETRQRLSENVETIIRRLIDFASDGLSPTVHSIALPAIGSTSHRAGDSEYFMTFTEGFISILKGIEESRPNEYLDRIYLVAYDQHMGLFKDDVLNALQDVKKYLFLKNIVRNQIKFVIAGILTILYTVFCITSYQNYREILKHNNRWQFMRTILFFSAFAMSISWGASLILFEAFSLSIEMFLSLYIIFTILTLFGINWLGKNSIF